MEIDTKWLHLYFALGFEISYKTCEYFDARHNITLNLFFFNLTIMLPIWSKRDYECCPPTWGIAYHNQMFWIYTGGKGNDEGGNSWWVFDMPWMLKWVRTSTLLNDDTFFHETKQNFSIDSIEVKDRWQHTYAFEYQLKNGETQLRLATIKVIEREWRRKWLPFTTLFNRVVREIDISFNHEVGEQAGTYKGGILGCGFEIKKGESPLECLLRMEKEVKFN